MIYFLAIFAGACLGSFVTAASHRLPRDEDIVFSHSKCPKCGYKLKPLDLIPIISWIMSGAKCRKCKKHISVRYITAEIIMAAISLLLFLKFGVTIQYAIFLLLATILLVTIIADWETYIMPDSMTIAALLLGIANIYISGIWLPNLYGFMACLIVALGLRYGYLLIKKKEGLGMGDVKFLPVAGLWLGTELLPIYFILAGLLGVVTAIIWKIVHKNPIFPFGPALAVAMFILCVFQDTVLNFMH